VWRFPTTPISPLLAVGNLASPTVRSFQQQHFSTVGATHRSFPRWAFGGLHLPYSPGTKPPHYKGKRLSYPRTFPKLSGWVDATIDLVGRRQCNHAPTKVGNLHAVVPTRFPTFDLATAAVQIWRRNLRSFNDLRTHSERNFSITPGERAAELVESGHANRHARYP
jgi:hypothetical protein